MALPPDTRVVGNTGHVTDHNAIVDAVKALQTAPVNTVATASTSQTLPAPSVDGIHDLTLTSASCAITLPSAVAGQRFDLVLRQDGTGGRAVTWVGTVKWPGGAAPTLTAAASANDVVTFLCVVAGTWLGFPAGYDVK